MPLQRKSGLLFKIKVGQHLIWQVIVSNQGRGRGRGRGRGQVQAYSFAVILLDSGQSSIPRGSQRNDLNSKGRIKQVQISRGAPAATTSRKIRDLFPELQRLVIIS